MKTKKAAAADAVVTLLFLAGLLCSAGFAKCMGSCIRRSGYPQDAACCSPAAPPRASPARPDSASPCPAHGTGNLAISYKLQV